MNFLLKRLILILGILLMGGPLYSPLMNAVIYEFSGNFSYSKDIYGSQRQNSMVSRSYSSGLALYLFSNTGIELGYGVTHDINTENNKVYIYEDLFISSVQNKVITKTSNIGLRQALAKRGSFLIPVFSFGYAKQERSGNITYTINNAGNISELTYDHRGTKSDSTFGAFTLKISLTQLFSINGTVKSVFPAFDWNKAKDNLRYDAGFSWMF
jgi:hypothetical protein